MGDVKGNSALIFGWAKSRREKYLSCRKSSCVKEWDWSAMVFAKFPSRAVKLLSNNASHKIHNINRGCNAFGYSSPSVQQRANSIFFSECNFGGKTMMSFLCWFSLPLTWKTILRDKNEMPKGTDRGWLGFSFLEDLDSEFAVVRGIFCWQRSAATAVSGTGPPVSQRVAIPCHTLEQALRPFCPLLPFLSPAISMRNQTPVCQTKERWKNAISLSPPNPSIKIIHLYCRPPVVQLFISESGWFAGAFLALKSTRVFSLSGVSLFFCFRTATRWSEQSCFSTSYANRRILCSVHLQTHSF